MHPPERPRTRTRSPRRISLLLAVAATLTVAMTACGTTGRDLREPPEGAVSPTRSTASTASTTTTATVGPTFTLSTTSFSPGSEIPATFSCTGPSPQLAWSGVPADASELVLVVIDPDSDPPGFVHWLVTGIPAADGSTPEGVAPDGGTEQLNSAGSAGWFGPCPPPGSAHTYSFLLHAMPSPFAVDPGEAATDVSRRAAREAIGTAAFTGSFQRSP